MKGLVTSLILITAFIVSLFISSYHGNKSRTYFSKPVVIGEKIPEIVEVEEQKEVYYIWKKYNLYGRVVLHFDTAMDIKPLAKKDGFFYYGKFLLSPTWALTNENFMLFGVTEGIVRKLIGIVPDRLLTKIDEDLKKSRYVSYKKFYRGWIEGTPKIVVSLKNYPFVDVKEVALLDFDVNYFSDPDISADGLYKELKSLKIKTDLITFSSSKNGEDIEPIAVEKMRRFIKLLRGEA